MKKLVVLFISFLVGCGAAFADTIVTKNNEQIECKIVEVGLETLKYKRADNADGPDYMIKKSDIKSVVYANGKTETFNTVSDKKPRLYIAEPVPYNGEPITFSTRKGFAFADGDTITEGQYLYLTQQYCLEANRQYLKGEKLRRAGKWLMAFGAPATILGVGFFVGMPNDKSYKTIGTVLMCVGAPTLVAGVPLFVVGIKQKQKSVATFNANRPQATISLNIAPNNVGLALNF